MSGYNTPAPPFALPQATVLQRCWALLLVFGLLAGCVMPAPAPVPAPATQAWITPSPTFLAQSVAQPETTPAPAPQVPQDWRPASPAPDPLRFVFPEAGPVPVSAWRPPLYPTPWVPTAYDHFFFARPIAADKVNWPLADYRYGGLFFEDIIHTGIDIPSPVDTPVLAAAGGKVIWAGYGLFTQIEGDPDDPYGLAVAIKHDFGYEGERLYTVYGHMNEIFVSRGQRVDGGDKIGTIGTTGKTTGPHLHFEVRIGTNNFLKTRNPELWLSPPQGWGVLAARITNTFNEPLRAQRITIRSYDTNQYWTVITYGAGAVQSDPYYQENMVIGDMPAGRYVVWVPFDDTLQSLDIEIRPGMVTYFNFHGKDGFTMEPPPPPTQDFVPPVTDTPNPAEMQGQ